MAARTDITVVDLQSHAGKELAYTNGDSTNGMQFDNDGRTVLLCKTDGVTAVTVTVLGVQDANRRKADLVLALAVTKEGFLGPFPFELFGQAGGKVFVDLSADSGFKITAMRMRN